MRRNHRWFLGAIALAKIKAKKWFSSAAADQPAASTKLSVSIGTQCFSHAVTKKTD